ncbi:MAG TPA: hypothetical protein VIS99_04925 [Terrimicrobiaceae bacterium]
MDHRLLRRLHSLAAHGVFGSRSEAIQKAVAEKPVWTAAAYIKHFIWARYRLRNLRFIIMWFVPWLGNVFPSDLAT